MMMRTGAVGKAGEYLVISDLLLRGCRVLVDVDSSSHDDLLIVLNGRYIRVQVKTATNTATECDSVTIPLCHNLTGTKEYVFYVDRGIDLMAYVAVDRKQIVYFPLERDECRRSVTVRFSAPKNNQRNVLLAENLTFEEAIRKINSRP